MSDEHLDRQLAEMTDDPRLAKAIEDSLRKLKDGAGGPALAEMADEILSGRSNLRGLAQTSVYATELTGAVERFRDWEAETPLQEREHVAGETLAALGTESDRPNDDGETH
ncbi:hypothetical protein M1L60_19915 [Actinoplanes sp. TRM 88003]|uniref:Uncharacterized protein n=1 Tax=Paractinoplanes aksuensis TaxID=2939490 RepID=A0ABT1DPY9_9ACTN|nr:hypothetical protein [Actinoplanes aksuensis]MCO8272865.1 hypothetical protein [Actinoplanes aksuensis]